MIRTILFTLILIPVVFTAAYLYSLDEKIIISASIVAIIGILREIIDLDLLHHGHATVAHVFSNAGAHTTGSTVGKSFLGDTCVLERTAMQTGKHGIVEKIIEVAAKSVSKVFGGMNKIRGAIFASIGAMTATMYEFIDVDLLHHNYSTATHTVEHTAAYTGKHGIIERFFEVTGRWFARIFGRSGFIRTLTRPFLTVMREIFYGSLPIRNLANTIVERIHNNKYALKTKHYINARIVKKIPADVRSDYFLENLEMFVKEQLLPFCFSCLFLTIITMFLFDRGALSIHVFFVICGIAVFVTMLTDKLGHLLMARRYGAGFKLEVHRAGASLSLVLAILLHDLSTSIMKIKYSSVKEEKLAKIALAGPYANLILFSFAAFAFLQVKGTGGLLEVLFHVIAPLSLAYGLYSLLPISPVAGKYVWKYNKKLWALTSIPFWLIGIAFIL